MRLLTEKKMKKKNHRTESERRGGKSARTGLCTAFVTGFMIVTGLIGTASGRLVSGRTCWRIPAASLLRRYRPEQYPQRQLNPT